MSRRAPPGKNGDLEPRLDVQRITEAELLDELERGRAAREHHVLSAVDLVAVHLERGRLAAEQTGALVQVDTPAPFGEREPSREAREARTDDGDPRLPCHTAASH